MEYLIQMVVGSKALVVEIQGMKEKVEQLIQVMVGGAAISVVQIQEFEEKE